MNLYLDASALVKRYVMEPGAYEVRIQLDEAELLTTVQITLVEVVAALAKAVRVGTLTRKRANQGMLTLYADWVNLQIIEISDELTNRAASLAWQHNLRGYDAMHLAGALAWQERFNEMITMATYDQQLWTVVRQVGVAVYPPDLPTLLANW